MVEKLRGGSLRRAGDSTTFGGCGSGTDSDEEGVDNLPLIVVTGGHRGNQVHIATIEIDQFEVSRAS